MNAHTTLITTCRPAINAGWFYVPYEAIPNLAAEKKKLTHKSAYAEKGDLPIRMYKDLPAEGYLGVPRAYGQVRFAHLQQVDRRVDGEPMFDPIVRLPDPNHPAVKEPVLQARFMVDMEEATQRLGNFIAYATTGSGKTVVGARNAAIYHRKAAILVPLERLLEQWRNELMEKLGVPEHRIGIVQSDTCEWRDKDYVLCMMKSLGQRRYEPGFYKSIGQVYVDEAHRLGTHELAATPALFPARVRIALSATPDRKDGSDRTIFWHVGQVEVKSEATALDCDIYVRSLDASHMNGIQCLDRKKLMGIMLKKLTLWDYRNQMLANDIVRLWRAGRLILAMSDHVAHVQDIMERVVRMGIPRSQIGQCTGERVVVGVAQSLRVVDRQRLHDRRAMRVDG